MKQLAIAALVVVIVGAIGADVAEFNGWIYGLDLGAWREIALLLGACVLAALGLRKERFSCSKRN